ncbi:MAG: ThiF family adenylyltransferase [Syntrophobacterales bacterium]|nr:ThiF family adenylyltransferase [Syntrophobacterales bacterium]
MTHIRLSERLDRQLRIPGWRQELLSQARVGVVGEADLLTALVVAGAAALGLNRLTVLAPGLEPRLLEAARRLNPDFSLAHLEGWCTHPAMARIFAGCQVLVDLSRYGLATKILMEEGRRTGMPLVRALVTGPERALEGRFLTCLPGRETQELAAVLPDFSFPRPAPEDAALALVLAGLVLEEVKNRLMSRRPPAPLAALPAGHPAPGAEGPLLIIGAGALGNVVALGLVWSGLNRLVVMDPDTIETTNLNRQILFYEAVGERKALTLAKRLQELYGARAEGRVESFTEATDLTPYAAVFDCVDNFETRVLLSEACRAQGKILVSGGAGVEAGQVVVYHPAEGGPTPAELLGLEAIVSGRAQEEARRTREACVYQPDPAVIMTNLIIGGLMVRAGRQALAGLPTAPVFYEQGRLAA